MNGALLPKIRHPIPLTRVHQSPTPCTFPYPCSRVLHTPPRSLPNHFLASLLLTLSYHKYPRPLLSPRFVPRALPPLLVNRYATPRLLCMNISLALFMPRLSPAPFSLTLSYRFVHVPGTAFADTQFRNLVPIVSTYELLMNILLDYVLNEGLSIDADYERKRRYAMSRAAPPVTKPTRYCRVMAFEL